MKILRLFRWFMRILDNFKVWIQNTHQAIVKVRLYREYREILCYIYFAVQMVRALGKDDRRAHTKHTRALHVLIHKKEKNKQTA